MNQAVRNLNMAFASAWDWLIVRLYNLSIQSFVTFAAFIKVNIYHVYLYINIVLPILYLVVKLNILSRYTHYRP